MGYRTVAGYGIDEHVEKKSRFIGQAWPVASEEEAREIIEKTRKEYWDASHNVFAFRIGSVQRFSDDGEPSGTSGKPTLDVLVGENVDNVLVITTRYFGGTLLGTGGLVRAYTKGAQIALKAAGIIEKKVYVRCSIAMDYTYLSKMQYLVGKKGIAAEDTAYEDLVTMHLLIPEEEAADFEKEVISQTEGRLQVKRDSKVMGAVTEGKIRLFDEPV